MAHWRQHFNESDKTIGACDLYDETTEKYIPRVVIIDRFTKLEMAVQGGKENKTVAYLQGIAKPMICNKTNFGRLVTLFNSPDDKHFIGKPITLQVENVTDPKDKKGPLVPALRFSARPVAPAVKTKPAITEANFPTALEQVKSGKTTKEKLMEQRSLTEDQIRQIDELQSEKQ